MGTIKHTSGQKHEENVDTRARKSFSPQTGAKDQIRTASRKSERSRGSYGRCNHTGRDHDLDAGRERVHPGRVGEQIVVPLHRESGRRKGQKRRRAERDDHHDDHRCDEKNHEQRGYGEAQRLPKSQSSDIAFLDHVVLRSRIHQTRALLDWLHELQEEFAGTR